MRVQFAHARSEFSLRGLEIVGEPAFLPQVGAQTQKAPLAGGFSTSLNSMSKLGAGTGFEPVTFRL
jgi:hypothetical protein